MSLYGPLKLVWRRGFLRPHPLHHSIKFRLASAHPVAKPSRNPFKRVAHYIRNDPFARVSLLFGGTVLVVLLVIESFIPKRKKKIKPQVAILPPHVLHTTVPREKELSSLAASLPSVFAQKPSVVIVTGPSGSGKTELTHQFISHFIEASVPLVSRKESSKPIVVYLDATKPHLFDQSILYAAGSLGLTSSQLSSDISSLQCLFTKLGEQKAKWLLVMDGVNNEMVTLIGKFLEGVTTNSKLRKGYILMTSSIEGEGLNSLLSHSTNHIPLHKG